MSNYNIDALRNDDGTYARAGALFISGALRCGHTAHIQTDLGVLAIRPYKIEEIRRRKDGTQYFPGERRGKNWLLEFYPTGHSRHGEEIRLYTALRDEAMEFAYKHLNGCDHSWQAGQSTTWYANQARRDADVLAVVGNEVLIEYVMPGTTNGRETSALVLCEIHGVTRLRHVRNYTHRKLPVRWVKAMNDQGTQDWLGLGQRERDEVPFPTL